MDLTPDGINDILYVLSAAGVVRRARIGADYVEVEYFDAHPEPETVMVAPPPREVVKPTEHPTEKVNPGYAALFGDNAPRFSKAQG